MPEDTTLDGVVEASFVRKDFYLDPPEKGASPEVWAAWIEADKQAASAAKRAFTRQQKHQELPEHLQPKAMVKQGGVWRQSALVGFVGDPEQGTARVEAAIDADQESKAHLRPWAEIGGRGQSTAARKGSSKRARAKALRKARKGQN